MITVSEDDDDDVELVGIPQALDLHTREQKSDKTDLKVANWSPTPRGVSEWFLIGTSAQLGYTVPFKLDVK